MRKRWGVLIALIAFIIGGPLLISFLIYWSAHSMRQK
jgi:uncharacterized protein YpmB